MHLMLCCAAVIFQDYLILREGNGPHFTSYSFTISGTWSFSSSFCCLLSSVSMQWWQQRIFSSSFSSSMDVTLLKLLMLPLLGPIPLLVPPDAADWEWTGLPTTHRASRVPVISFSVNRTNPNHSTGRRHISQKELFYIVYIYIRTSQRQKDKFHTLSAHDRPTKTTVVPPVPDVELVSTVRTEWHIWVIHPRHHWFLNGYQKGKKLLIYLQN